MNLKPLIAQSLFALLGLGTPSISLGAPILWNPVVGGNGHYYDLVLFPNLSWSQANATANTFTYNTLPGHLVTIASAEEQAFLQSNLTLSGNLRFWLGAFQDTTAPDYAEPAGGWRWVTSEPFSYADWNISSNPSQNQPNNFSGYPEDFLATFIEPWKWNDLIDYPLPTFGAGEQPIGFIVEYQPVPEPTSLLLISVGLATLVAWRRRRNDLQD